MARSRALRLASMGALVLGLACGPESPGEGSAAPAGAEAPDTSAERLARDLAAIEELHRRDQEASLAGDWPTLMGLWSDEPVALPPDGPVQRGRAAVERSMEGYREAAEVWETVEYVQEFGEVEVAGDYAWDWGTFRGRSRNRRTGREVSSSGKLLRILKRAPDGSWKVHRSIWNVAPQASPDASPGA